MADGLTKYYLELEGLKKYDALIKKHIPVKGTTAYLESDEVKNTFVPESGQIVIYSDYRKKSVGETEIVTAAIKIGDGTSSVGSLQFIDWFYWNHVNDTNIHVSADEKAFWNNKVSLATNGETIIFKTSK